MSNAVTEVNQANFSAEVLENSLPVLVDFWAPWCAPCRAIAPIVEEVAGEFAGRLEVRKLNVDDNQEIASKYNVRGIPTLILFQDGNVADQIVGAIAKSQLVSFLNRER